MMYVKCEVRRYLEKTVEYNDKKTGEPKSFIQRQLKVELENGSDIYLSVNDKLATEENIKYLEELRGQMVSAPFWLKHKDKYLNYNLSDMPELEV